MNYELAKELKEAGFPQKEFTFDQPFSGHWPANVRPVDFPYNPTLEELIEACGEGFEGVRKVSIEFDHTHYWLAETDNNRGIACKGLSPTEAVANLWLALKK
jgi:hypothetical protein